MKVALGKVGKGFLKDETGKTYHCLARSLDGKPEVTFLYRRSGRNGCTK
jgi:hypothetical protein